nr:hypothetical protein [Limnohabitans sp. 2KL-51]
MVERRQQERSSLEWLEPLEKVGLRENFNTLMHAHICQVWIARDEDAGSGIKGQCNEFIVCGITTDDNLCRHLEVLHGLGNLDQVRHAAGVPKIPVKLWPRYARLQLMPSLLILSNHKVLNGEGQNLGSLGLG